MIRTLKNSNSNGVADSEFSSLPAALDRPNWSRKLSRVQSGFGLGIGTAD
jgi:hypothetical protein